MKQKSINQFLIFILILFHLSSCSVNKFDEEAIYQNLNEDREMEVDPSIIQTGVRVSIKELEKKINTDLAGVLIEDEDFKKWGRYYVKSKITSRGDIKLSSNENEIIFAVPAHFEGIVKVNESFLGVKIQAQPKFELDCDITLAAKIAIDQELKPIIKSRIVDIKWPYPPGINAGPIKIDLSEALEMIIRENESRISKIVATKAKESFDIQNEIRKLDITINTQEEIEIDNLSYFLSAVPQNILLAKELRFDGVNALINAGVSAEFKIESNKQADSLMSLKDVEIQVQDLRSDKFDVNVKLAMSYSDISNLILEKLEKSQLEVNSNELKITEVRCGKFDDERLWIFLELDAGMQAEVFANARIDYDSAQKSIIIKDLRKQIFTGNTLTDFLLSFAPLDTDKIEHKFNRIELQSLYNSIDKKIAMQVNQLSLSDDLDIEIDDLTYRISEFNLKKDELELIANARGRSALKLNLIQ